VKFANSARFLLTEFDQQKLKRIPLTSHEIGATQFVLLKSADETVLQAFQEL
jgi:hypothetical protein